MSHFPFLCVYILLSLELSFSNYLIIQILLLPNKLNLNCHTRILLNNTLNIDNIYVKKYMKLYLHE